MEFYRKLLIVTIILLTLIIVLRFLHKRALLQYSPSGPLYLETFMNPFSIGSATPQTESDAIQQTYSTIPTGIVNTKDGSLALNQYFVKASANSAYSGTFVSTDMLKVVLSRGCRFLDFQIFSVNSDAVVGVNLADGTMSRNQIPLKDVFNTILIHGMNTTAPNPKDPLFIQLRIHAEKNSGIYESIGLLIQTILAGGSFLYTNGIISSKTPLSELMGKIVILIDVSLSPDYKNPKNYKNASNNLVNFVGMESNTTDVPSYSYDMALSNVPMPVFVNPSPNDKTTNVSVFSIIHPQNDIQTNPNYKEYVKKYGYNVIAYQYYLTDSTNRSKLAEYEAVFGTDGYASAFVPMYQMLQLA